MSEQRIVTFSRFQADLSQALARRGKRLLESIDLAARVSELEPLEAYFIVKELGVEEAAPILRYCSDEQIRTFIDLDCWDGATPDGEEIDAWLAPFAATGLATLAEAFLDIDESLQVWFLSDSLHVFEPAEAELLPEPIRGAARKTTPDTCWVVESRHAERREIDPLTLVESLYAADFHEAFRLLAAVRWELPSFLEEQAYRFRTARVTSLGFPSPDVALGLFAAPRAHPDQHLYVPKAVDKAHLPALYAEPLTEKSLLARALERVGDTDMLAYLEETLRDLINHAVVAYGGAPRDVLHVMGIAGRVRDTVSLGIEAALSPEGPLRFPDGEDAAVAAAELLGRWSLFDLFRNGHREVRGIQEAARALATDPAVIAWRERVQTEKDDYGDERNDRELLAALLADPPLDAGTDPVHPDVRQAFGGKRQIEAAERRLDRIRERVR